jgi:hypothetical protein
MSFFFRKNTLDQVLCLDYFTALHNFRLPSKGLLGLCCRS